MRVKALRQIIRLSIFLAILACSALLVDSVGVTPAYCSGASGCQVAKLAARRVLGPVSLPALGLIAWVGLLGVTTAPRVRSVRRLELVAATLAPIAGAALIAIQAFVLKTYCPYCMVVDTAAVVVGAALWIAHFTKADGDDQRQGLHPVAIGALASMAALLPVLWPHFRPPLKTPEPLVAFQQPGRVSIVEFVDLSCGHCRALYSTLERLRRAEGERIHFVRLHAPHRAHRAAREGARLLACLQGDEARVEKLTEVLFESPSLDHAVVAAAGEYVGLTQEEMQACWNDAASEESVAQNVRLLDSLGFVGLPTTYIGGERIIGSQPLPIYQVTLERVSRSEGAATLETVAFCGAFAALGLGVILLGRQRRRQPRR
ncbi:MAG TPA: DsbA family protein [Polyangiaceae bacterium]